MHVRPTLVLVAALTLGTSPAWAQSASDDPLGGLPIREVTVFKDGHAFVLHEGDVPTDEAGDVIVEHLPRAVLGTFWPYARQSDATLRSVVASRGTRERTRRAINLRELLTANVGNRVRVSEVRGKTYDAEVIAVPTRDGPNPNPHLANAPPTVPIGDLVLLRTDDGVRAVQLAILLDVTLLGDAKTDVVHEEETGRLRLDLEWEGAPRPSARVGMAYLQRGLRWNPSYKIEIDGSGKARIRLQATLVNELADLHDVTTHLVVGVPTFRFANQLDPVALEQSAAAVSPHVGYGYATSYMLSNAIQSQVMMPSGRFAAPVMDGADAAIGERSEDLHVFTVEGITLAEGERMVVDVATFDLGYEDIYTLHVPLSPPADVQCGSLNPGQRDELERALRMPKLMHVLRLTNSSATPLTTGPALIMRDGRVLAQGLVTYTASGGHVDVEVTASTEVQLHREAEETGRESDAVTINGSSFTQVSLTGRIALVHRGERPIKVEVSRDLLGMVDRISADGIARRVDLTGEGGARLPVRLPHWWGWYSWPNWWQHVNGVSRLEWKATIKPGEELELTYDWHYFWR